VVTLGSCQFAARRSWNPLLGARREDLVSLSPGNSQEIFFGPGHRHLNFEFSTHDRRYVSPQDGCPGSQVKARLLTEAVDDVVIIFEPA
jgi:hypothetical protein